MQLREFIEKKGIKNYQFADAIGIPAPHLSEIIYGKRGIQLKVAIRILEVCEGEVTLQELADIPCNRKKRKTPSRSAQQTTESGKVGSSSMLETAKEWCRRHLQ